MGGMKRRILLLALPFAALPFTALAQEAEPSEGLGRVGDGAREILRGLVEEAEPAIEGIAGIGAELLPTFRLIAQEMGPAFAEVFGQVDALSNYEPPVFLPNGDIVLRRRDGAPPFTPPEAAPAEPGDEAEL